MQKEVTSYKYFCDSCDKELTEISHICIENAQRFGLVSPPFWQFPKTRNFERTYQFCDGSCLESFLNDKEAGNEESIYDIPLIEEGVTEALSDNLAGSEGIFTVGDLFDYLDDYDIVNLIDISGVGIKSIGKLRKIVKKYKDRAGDR